MHSPVDNIKGLLENEKLDTWGWVFYRCTYNDEEAWTRFKRGVIREMQDELAWRKTPELEKSLALTFLEDQEAFEGASKAQLRAYFQKWVPGAFASENPRTSAEFGGPMPLVRYRYFFQIDEASLRSIVYEGRYPPEEYLEGYVNFVDGYWKTLSELGLEDDENPWPDEPGEYDAPIEGCIEENVGWMKLDAADISMEWYDGIDGFEYESWYIFYQRPPAIVTW
ncbi:uncharacterized protein LDX57_005691 [Aspergillus melleus]|uniref:uncharacterized protein n=1 Tax=Aspergillus melleus TaxID=138277 RepID=UPI001E8E58BB|nr:uncharacterized protein LDX57_005691 [Aspergillus melleus]KAH8427985.1 hypothetical protein LDX57_005691 [Aspergillus melleus]